MTLVAIISPLTTSIKKWFYYVHTSTPALHPPPHKTKGKEK